MERVYQKTQLGTTSLIVVVAILLFLQLTGWITSEPPLLLRSIEIILVVVAIPLLALTIRVTSTSIEWWFLLGIARQRVSLSEIEGARSIKTSLISGLGVHWSGDNILWAVAGPHALTLDLSDGRHISISTNEPDRVVEVLRSLSNRVSRAGA